MFRRAGFLRERIIPDSTLIMSEKVIARSDVWRAQYSNDRYARHLSHPELILRLRDIVLNLLTVAPGGIGFMASDINPDEISNESTAWLEKGTHVLEEFALRYGRHPAGFDANTLPKESLPDFASELAKKAARRLAAMGIKPGDVFIKYGKRNYMEMLHESGALRIQPAIYFSETTHNQAIKDDELTLPLSVTASREELASVLPNCDKISPDIANPRVDVTLSLPSDYWLYCVSSSLTPRLFVDYNADACVIIRDRDRFTRMIGEASLAKLRVRYRPGPGRIEYVDPLLPQSIPSVAFSKHFRYSYQHEFRFCWLPPQNLVRVRHCDVAIGGLKEFSDLVVL